MMTDQELEDDPRTVVGRAALVALLQLVLPLAVVTALAALLDDQFVPGVPFEGIRIGIVVLALAIAWGAPGLRRPSVQDWLWRRRRLLMGLLVSLATFGIAIVADDVGAVAVAGMLLLSFAAAQWFPREESRRWVVVMVAAIGGGLAVAGATPADVLLAVVAFVFVAAIAGERTRMHVEAIHERRRAAEEDAQGHNLLATITALTDLDERAVLEELVAAVARMGHVRVEATLGEVVVTHAVSSDTRRLGEQETWSLGLHAHRPGSLVVTAAAGSPVGASAVGQLVAVARATLRNAERFEEHRGSIRRLTALDVARNDFVSSVSHELRTPLTVVKGLGHTLASGMVPIGSPEGRRLLARIDANAIRLETMVESLLNVGTVHRRGLDIAPILVDLGAHVAATLDRLSPLADDHDLVVQTDPDCHVVADPGLLDHVLENLLANACKYTPVGSRVQVTVRRHDDTVQVGMADDGPGIDPRELPRLTERFFRGGAENTRDTSGLGLGLSLVSEILEAHDSRLEVSSAKGAGSRFVFALQAVGPETFDAAGAGERGDPE